MVSGTEDFWRQVLPVKTEAKKAKNTSAFCMSFISWSPAQEQQVQGFPSFPFAADTPAPVEVFHVALHLS